MKTATPEQIRLFRRRRFIANVGMVGIFLLGFLLGVIALHHSDGLTVGVMVLIGLGVTAWKSAWMRCPICGHPMPKRGGSFGREPIYGTQCEKCDVSFHGETAAQDLAASRRHTFWLLVVAISLLVLIGGFWLLMVIL